VDTGNPMKPIILTSNRATTDSDAIFSDLLLMLSWTDLITMLIKFQLKENHIEKSLQINVRTSILKGR